MANTATAIILTAGTLTFANEWYQTKKVDWKVPVATLIMAAAFDGLAHLDSGAATMVSIMVLIGAATTKFDGKSIVDTVSENLGSGTTKKAAK